jgi:hypothetical protein
MYTHITYLFGVSKNRRKKRGRKTFEEIVATIL